ncbi:GTPase [Winogradskyella helgolandensis]|uniref:GTPase n=1 Tax=Winogradskyella helgolandensis TaxID=2697010 RepID=UPI0015C91C8B|nr:GTPase [Winogradskyella helgolandensis]
MKLLFVYNANSGKMNALFDAGHKFMSPSTYKCSLCALTFDTFSENRIWKDFRAKSNIDMEFYHKDEFETKFPNINMVFPAILKHEAHQMSTVLNADILNEISNVDDLIARLKLQF